MAVTMKNSFKTPSFTIFFLLLFISLSSPLPTTLPNMPLYPDYPSIDNTFPGPPPLLGYWTLLHHSIGTSAMHMQLLHNDKLIIFDRTDFGPSNLSLPSSSHCRLLNDGVSDCTAHSVLYDVASNTFRPLTVLTDTWCSSGSVNPDGTLIQTGGYQTGERVIRTFTPSDVDDDYCDWVELQDTYLAARRWYASNHILPDGRIIIVGGRGSYSYEFFPPRGPPPEKFRLRFLVDTWDGRNKENNLYPFLHLLPNGNLFIFANNRSVEFDYVAGRVVREFPIMPSFDRRNYPSTGSSVLLPLYLNETMREDDWPEEFEVLICGGAPPEAFDLADVENVYVAASKTCGRMKINSPEPQWIMEDMPMPRVMPDLVMLPTGDVLIINGASNGSAGWENAENPVLNPVLYRPTEPESDRRFLVMNPSQTPRMYHSCAALVADGRVIVGGSNPHSNYNFTPEAKYPTELSLEAFSPPYLDPRHAVLRPSILSVEAELGKVVVYGQAVSVTFGLGVYRPELGLAVTMIMPPFATHSFGMNQRLVVLGGEVVEQLSAFAYKVTVRAPVNVNVAPPGYYMLFVVHAGVPSHGVWVQLKRSLL